MAFPQGCTNPQELRQVTIDLNRKQQTRIHKANTQRPHSLSLSYVYLRSNFQHKSEPNLCDDRLVIPRPQHRDKVASEPLPERLSFVPVKSQEKTTP